MSVTVSAIAGSYYQNVDFDKVRKLSPGVGWWQDAQHVKDDGSDDVYVQMQNGDIYVASGQLPNKTLEMWMRAGSAVSIDGDVGEVVHLAPENNTKDELFRAKHPILFWVLCIIMSSTYD